MNPEFTGLAGDIYRRRVLRARKLTPEERLSTIFELQDQANAMVRGSVKMQFPGADDAEVTRIVAERRRRLRAISDQGIFQPAVDS